jgi:hypothetical protein
MLFGGLGNTDYFFYHSTQAREKLKISSKLIIYIYLTYFTYLTFYLFLKVLEQNFHLIRLGVGLKIQKSNRNN